MGAGIAVEFNRIVCIVTGSYQPVSTREPDDQRNFVDLSQVVLNAVIQRLGDLIVYTLSWLKRGEQPFPPET